MASANLTCHPPEVGVDCIPQSLESTRKTSIMDSGMSSRAPSGTHRERIAEWLSGLGDRLEDEFARLDVNGDGQITREELLRSGLPRSTCEAAAPCSDSAACVVCCRVKNTLQKSRHR